MLSVVRAGQGAVTTDIQPYERLILGLDLGWTLQKAATYAGLRAIDAEREARAFGWPELDGIREQADQLRQLYREEAEMTPRKPREPVPIEPDVEAAMMAGATMIREARASVALDRGQTHDVGPVTVAALATSTAARDADADAQLDAVVTWRADDVTDETMAEPAVEAFVDPIDQAFLDDTREVLGILDRVVSNDPLNSEQRARSAAMTEVLEMVRGICAPTTGELLTLADYVITGTVPVVMLDETR